LGNSYTGHHGARVCAATRQPGRPAAAELGRGPRRLDDKVQIRTRLLPVPPGPQFLLLDWFAVSHVLWAKAERSGFNEPDALAVIDKRSSEPAFHLLVREKDGGSELWDGPRSGTQAAEDVFNADAVRPLFSPTTTRLTTPPFSPATSATPKISSPSSSSMHTTSTPTFPRATSRAARSPPSCTAPARRRYKRSSPKRPAARKCSRSRRCWAGCA
jgi:hypothetical protein